MIQYSDGICAFPPGERIKLEMKQMGLANKEESVARTLELSLPDFRGLLEGELEVDKDLAERLADLFGIESTYWLVLERQYKKDLDLIGKLNGSIEC